MNNIMKKIKHLCQNKRKSNEVDKIAENLLDKLMEE